VCGRRVQIMKTEFVPKLVATVTVCCASYVVLAASDKIITVKTLASIGYFDALVGCPSCVDLSYCHSIIVIIMFVIISTSRVVVLVVVALSTMLNTKSIDVGIFRNLSA